MKFFKQSQYVEVSRITPDGWWLENCSEHVTAGTALGEEFTENRFIPSLEGRTARYNREADEWSNEIEDMTFKSFFDNQGREYVIGSPDGEYPEGAILEAPPEFNPETHTVLHNKESGWKVYEILLGKPYYDDTGFELIVSDYNFELPENHTWTPPPESREGYAFKLIEGDWREMPDHRGRIAYAKDRDDDDALVDYEVEELGFLPNTHTLEVPDMYDSWTGEQFEYDKERHRPVKASEETSWRNALLTEVVNRIDQYEKDQHYPTELRTSPINDHNDFLKLLKDRKLLSDYPDTEEFPFSSRPTLSGLVD